MTTSQFYPRKSNITGITKAQYAVVTFSADHDFTNGELISLRSSRPYGMYEVNNMRGRVLSHTDTEVTLDIDTTNFTTFVYPPVGTVEFPAMAVPAGSGIIPDQDDSQYGAQPYGTTLLDRFDHILVN